MKKILLAFSLLLLFGGVGCTNLLNNKNLDLKDITDSIEKSSKDNQNSTSDSKSSDRTTSDSKSDKSNSSDTSSSKYEKYADFDAAKDPLVDADGLDFDSWTLYADDVELDRDYQVPDGARLKMVFEGVSGYNEKDGRVFPGAYMTVSDLEGNTLLKEDDLFADYTEEGASVEDGKYISIYLTTGEPLQIGETYDWYIYVWDKESDGFIDAFVTFDLVA